jgi:hypothetical protein
MNRIVGRPADRWQEIVQFCPRNGGAYRDNVGVLQHRKEKTMRVLNISVRLLAASTLLAAAPDLPATGAGNDHRAKIY